MKLYVEDCPRITIGEIVKTAHKDNQTKETTFKNIFGDEAVIKTTETRLTFGKRIWFVCPDCKRRIGKLYLVNNILTCRCCHNLYYADRSQHRKKHFESVIKPLKKLIKMVRKFKNEG